MVCSCAVCCYSKRKMFASPICVHSHIPGNDLWLDFFFFFKGMKIPKFYLPFESNWVHLQEQVKVGLVEALYNF